jgi:hypothetical protein
MNNLLYETPETWFDINGLRVTMAEKETQHGMFV